MPIRVFISYKRQKLSKTVAGELKDRLTADGFQVFLDTRAIQGGQIWPAVIYREVGMSDVLVVLLEERTADSDWVQREVDTARGAHVSILPVKINPVVEITDALKVLAIEDVHYIDYFGADVEADYKTLTDNICSLCKTTKDAQATWIKSLQAKWRPVPAKNALCAAAFELRNRLHPCRIYLTTGDITKVRDIDVLVNSENNFMQMARVFETRHVSSVLRYAGSWENEAGHVISDAVQEELDQQIRLKVGIRPVALGKVIATNAGHPNSKLRRKQKARYIFHVATVEVLHGGVGIALRPVTEGAALRDCVAHCRDMTQDVDYHKGVISPENTEQRILEEENVRHYTPIRSIIFPLFGTGHGGSPVQDVVPAMLDAFEHFLSYNPSSPLEAIHLCVYAEEEVQPVKQMMAEKFDMIGSS